MISAYPLQWPDGWPRAKGRKSALFGKSEWKAYEGEGMSGGRHVKRDLTMADAMQRVRRELERLQITSDDFVVSTNLKLNLSGLPRGDQGEPGDPGVAVYFQSKNKPMRVIAIDAYQRVRDNLAAIAATLEAMRAIERHGGAQILERAFTGFDALPPPTDAYRVLGLKPGASRSEVEDAWRRAAREAHPDRVGGSHHRMAEVNAARDAIIKQLEGPQ